MYRRLFALLMVVVAVGSLLACGAKSDSSSGGNASAASGAVQLSLTDAPADGLDNVWITVKEVWFHTSDASGPGEAGWLKYPLASPVTVDLLTLGNGATPQTLWNSLTLPVGEYQQIRLFLVPTFSKNPVPPVGHAYYNEVVETGSTQALPLRIPDAEHGIRLVGHFKVVEGGTLRLAIDFDAGSDVIELQHKEEYVLKPRLAYFDLDNAGAIVGQIDMASAATYTSSRFVFKAEQLVSDGTATFHTVRRAATLVDPSIGRFVLYPLGKGTYDLVLRGIGYQTVIIKGVPVNRGTTPSSGATSIPIITMTPGADFDVNATITTPSGAWVNFYQKLAGAGEFPYEIRFKHFNPLTGSLSGFKLSADQLQVGSYQTGTLLSGPVAVTPAGGNGSFSAVADAILYNSSAPAVISASTGTVSFGTLSVTSPATAHSISGTISLPSTTMAMSLKKGVVFAIQGGMIVDSLQVDNQMMSNGGSYVMTNLPGGTLADPLPGAFYGVEAFGWSSTTAARAIAMPGLADLRRGNDTKIDLDMLLLP